MKQFNYGIQFKLPERKEELKRTITNLKTKMIEELIDMNAYNVNGKVVNCTVEQAVEKSAILRIIIQDGIDERIVNNILRAVTVEILKIYN